MEDYIILKSRTAHTNLLMTQNCAGEATVKLPKECHKNRSRKYEERSTPI